MARKAAESQEYKDFLKAVSDGTPASLYFFYGEEHYLMERYLEKIRELLIPDGLEEFNHRRFDGAGLTAAAIIDAVDMLPVFAERTLVEIHDYDIFKASESERKLITSLFADIPDYVCLIFIYDTIEFKPDKRLKDTKEILKYAHEVEFALQDGEKITRWICKHVKEGGKYIAPNDAEYLAFITGGHMTTLNTEIEKLCSYAASDSITRQDIDTCVIPITEAVTYKLANAVANGEYATAVSTLSDLIRLREPAHKILYSLSMTMRQLLWARINLDAGKNTRYFADAYGFKYEFQAKNLISSAKSLNTDTCKKAVLLCSDTALALNNGADPEAAMAGHLIYLLLQKGSLKMHKIKEVVIVEGRYDKNCILQCVDCTVIETSGFGLFNNKEKAALLKRLAETRGIIVMTDSDSAGFLIRNHIKGIVPTGIKHAYIPDVYGREKRKRSPSKEGKLGVEGMSPEIIVTALRNAGATFVGETAEHIEKESITKTDFFELGLTGSSDSSQRRDILLKKLSLPERMTTNSLISVVNILYGRDEFISLCKELFPL